MKKRDRERILVKYYESQGRYERLAKELHRLLDEDARFPAEAVYTVKHRLKKPDRLIEKIHAANSKARRGAKPIDHANFQARIDDLLGMRIICLRMADLAKLKEYLASLAEEKELRLVKGPIEKKTFLIRPGGADVAGGAAGSKPDMQYTGYSSIHYVVRLGSSLRPPRDLAELRAELQLRTILEEAWGEIDHKYRYELTRSGKPVPPHIETGFRDLGLYLQAAARQADHLCEDVDRIGAKPTRRRPPPPAVPVAGRPARGGPAPAAQAVQAPPTLRDLLRGVVGFEPTPRTLAYIERRLAEHSFHVGRPFTLRQLQEALSPQLVARFKEVYREVLQGKPFDDPEPSRRDLDVVPLVNFAIFSSVQSKSTAEAGLSATLRSRPER